MTKTVSKVGMEGNFPNPIKGIYEKPTSQLRVKDGTVSHKMRS